MRVHLVVQVLCQSDSFMLSMPALHVYICNIVGPKWELGIWEFIARNDIVGGHLGKQKHCWEEGATRIVRILDPRHPLNKTVGRCHTVDTVTAGSGFNHRRSRTFLISLGSYSCSSMRKNPVSRGGPQSLLHFSVSSPVNSTRIHGTQPVTGRCHGS
jgi:hypothetical protein